MKRAPKYNFTTSQIWSIRESRRRRFRIDAAKNRKYALVEDVFIVKLNCCPKIPSQITADTPPISCSTSRVFLTLTSFCRLLSPHLTKYFSMLVSQYTSTICVHLQRQNKHGAMAARVRGKKSKFNGKINTNIFECDDRRSYILVWCVSFHFYFTESTTLNWQSVCSLERFSIRHKIAFSRFLSICAISPILICVSFFSDVVRPPVDFLRFFFFNK